MSASESAANRPAVAAGVRAAPHSRIRWATLRRATREAHESQLVYAVRLRPDGSLDFLLKHDEWTRNQRQPAPPTPAEAASQGMSRRKQRSRDRKAEFKRNFPHGKHADARTAGQLSTSPATDTAAVPSPPISEQHPAPSPPPAESSQGLSPLAQQRPSPSSAADERMSERVGKRAPSSPLPRDSPVVPSAKRSVVLVGGQPPLSALLPPSQVSEPSRRPNPASVSDFINAAVVRAEAGSLDALRAEIRSMAGRVASLTCSDLEVIVSGMLEAEGQAVRQDRSRGIVLSDSAGLQRQLAWLQAYQREVLEGPGSEFPDVYPPAARGKGGRAAGRGGRARGGPSLGRGAGQSSC